MAEGDLMSPLPEFVGDRQRTSEQSEIIRRESGEQEFAHALIPF
jgi:hypothetical protein